MKSALVASAWLAVLLLSSAEVMTAAPSNHGFPSDNPSQPWACNAKTYNGKLCAEAMKERYLRQQQCLARLGFDPGPIDGQWGTRSQAAMDAWLKREYFASWDVVNREEAAQRLLSVCARGVRRHASGSAEPTRDGFSSNGKLSLWLFVFEVVAIIGFLVFIPAMIAAHKGRSFGGFLLYGVLLWPIALIHALVMAPTTEARQRRAQERGEVRSCPVCMELVQAKALRCRFCGHDFGMAAREPDASIDRIK